MWQFVAGNELYHHGIVGMRWGVRRWQRKDGSLTPAGRRRAAKLAKKYRETTGIDIDNRTISTTKRSMQDMSDDELRDRTNRLNLETSYIKAVKERRNVVKKGESWMSSFMKKTVLPNTAKVATTAATEYFKNKYKD